MNESSKLLKWRYFAAIAVLATAVPVQTAVAADVLEEITPQERMMQPAVSGVNAKLEAAYLHYDLDETDGKGYLLQGAVSIPVGQQFGFQFDAGTLNADLDSDEILANGFGGHLFWRDPSVGLLGLYGHHVQYDNAIEISRLGVEAEVYAGQLTFEGFAGVDHLDTPIGDEEFLAAEGVISWYATDNFRLLAGVQHSFDQTRGLVGLEAMVDSGDFAPSLYANAAMGEDETTVMAGVRLYLGTSKSLKARHREDDPAIGLFEQFGAASNCLANDDAGVSIVTDLGNPPASSAANAKLYVPLPTSAPKYKLDGCGVREKRPKNG